jgi:hypothetical protein
MDSDLGLHTSYPEWELAPWHGEGPVSKEPAIYSREAMLTSWQEEKLRATHNTATYPTRGNCKLKVIKGCSNENIEYNSTYSAEYVEEATPLDEQYTKEMDQTAWR